MITERLRPMRRLLPIMLGGVVLSGCSFIGLSPRTPAAPPARWEARFCDAQEWVAAAQVWMREARDGIDRTRDREVLEDLGDDAADTARRALDFLALVPDWEPGADLLDAERAMLRQAITAGELLEEIALTGPVSDERLRPARVALRTMGDAMRVAAAASRRADARGIPCAVPELTPLVPPEIARRR